MKLTAQQALLAAAQVFEDYPERWTEDALVKDKKGVETNIGSPTAYCFCAHGIMWQMEFEGLTTQEVNAEMYRKIDSANCNLSMVITNDCFGREAVIAMFRKAAE